MKVEVEEVKEIADRHKLKLKLSVRSVIKLSKLTGKKSFALDGSPSCEMSAR